MLTLEIFQESSLFCVQLQQRSGHTNYHKHIFTPDSKDSSTAQNEIPNTFLVLTVLHSQYYGEGTSYNSSFENMDEISWCHYSMKPLGPQFFVLT